MTTFRWYLLGLLAFFGAYVALEYYRPKPLDWSPTYANKDKIPYGSYVLFDQLPRLLGTDSITTVRRSVYSQLTGADEPGPITDDDTQDTNPAALADVPATTRANYLFINEEFTATATDARALLRFVARGNDVFIAARSFEAAVLRDTLGIRTADALLHPRPSVSAADSVEVRFTNPALAQARYRLPAQLASTYLAVQVGHTGQTLATDAHGRAVFVRLAHGRGHFYLCSVPLAFTNYFVLRPATTAFAAGALAYLPARPTWWDEFQKQGPVGEQSLLRVVQAHEALRWACWLLAGAVLLFVLNGARRRQRIIPIIKPLPNTTLLFARTVASLYQQGRNHARIGEKKVALFLDYLRVRFHETNPDLADDAFRERLSQKAGLPRPRIDELLRLVNFARTAPQFNDRELLQLSRALSDFRREAG